MFWGSILGSHVLCLPVVSVDETQQPGLTFASRVVIAAIVIRFSSFLSHLESQNGLSTTTLYRNVVTV